jgi:hypothetical protein
MKIGAFTRSALFIYHPISRAARQLKEIIKLASFSWSVRPTNAHVITDVIDDFQHLDAGKQSENNQGSPIWHIELDSKQA